MIDSAKQSTSQLFDVFFFQCEIDIIYYFLALILYNMIRHILLLVTVQYNVIFFFIYFDILYESDMFFLLLILLFNKLGTLTGDQVIYPDDHTT